MEYLIHLLLLINLHFNQTYKYVYTNSPKHIEININKLGQTAQFQEQYTKQIVNDIYEGTLLEKGRRKKTPLEVEIKPSFKISNKQLPADSNKKNTNISTHQGIVETTHITSSYFVFILKNLCQNGEKRDKFRNVLSRYLESDVSGIAEGFLLGGTTSLEKPLLRAVKVAGVSHILSASGSNVSLFLLINSPILWKYFGKNFTAFVGVASLIWYLQLAGCTPPLIRAVVGAVLTLTASLLFLQHSALRILVVTFLSIVFINSNYITNIGFQLSVAATLGIIVFTRSYPNKNREQIDVSMYYLNSHCYHSKLTTANFMYFLTTCEVIAKQLFSSCKSVLLTTLAAQLLTLPIILLYFGELSTIALVSNMLLLWLVPLVVTTSIITVALGAVSLHMLATLMGTLTTFFTRTFLVILQTIGQYDVLLIHLTAVQVKWTLFVYFVILLILFNRKKSRKNTSSFKNYYCQC
jgi:ComEC/Rec2-related protein